MIHVLTAIIASESKHCNLIFGTNTHTPFDMYLFFDWEIHIKQMNILYSTLNTPERYQRDDSLHDTCNSNEL